MEPRIHKTTASANASASLLLRLAPLPVLCLALAALVLLIASAQGQQLELQVEECNADKPACSRTQTIEAEPQADPKPERAPGKEPEPTASPQETHDYDLRSGKGTVESGGEVEETSLELDLSPDDGGEDHAGEDKDDDARLTDGGGRAPVTTNGGSPFAGFGADFLSGDEAVSRFAVPPFLIPIYVAAGRAYDVPWNLLAAINQIETDFGRIRQQVSYAGALGWMQFMPGTWRAYGVDASGDGVADPFNPVDAIYAAARYLSASGAPNDLRRAVFAYNHADWYVDRVLRTASIYGSLPSGLVAETGSLAFGRFPLKGRVSYADDFRRAQAAGKRPQGLWLSGQPGARAVATQNVKVVEVQLDRKLAAVLRRRSGLARHGLRPLRPASTRLSAAAGARTRASRLIRPAGTRSDGLPKGYGLAPVDGIGVVVEDKLGNRYGYAGLERIRGRVRPGERLQGGDPIGEVGSKGGSRLLFSVRAAGGARVDPRPLVDGYRLQEVADFYNAVAPLADNPFVVADGEPLAGVTGSARELASRVLSASGIDIYPGGREDIRRGVIDKRVLGTLLYLRRNGLELTVTSLRSGHSFYTASGNVSAHSFGAAADIAAFNGQPVIGNQGPGSLTEQAIKLLMRLDGSARPAQLISLMNLGGPSFAMGDHDDHLHLGYAFQPSLAAGRSGNVLGPVDFDAGGGPLEQAKVARRHEQKLSQKLGGIENPSVSRKRGAGALRVETESPIERDHAERLAQERRAPLVAQPAAAGVRVADVDVPARGEAWAIGTVDGGRRRGWAATQTVLTRYAAGTWSVVGPPVDARGRIVNPRLRALATVHGGRGYAVGDRGAVVELRGDRRPLLLESATSKPLSALDVSQAGRRIAGIAVGAAGTVVGLEGRSAVRERAGSADLAAVRLQPGGALAAGGRSGAAALLRRNGQAWRPEQVDFGLPSGVRARVTALDSSAGELWVVGAVSDSDSAEAAELPFAARLSGGEWKTFCAGRPALAAIAELGTPTSSQVCTAGLTGDPNDTGAAVDVAITSLGAVVSTSRGIHVYSKGSFQPVAAEPLERARLALSSSGSGFAVGEDGRLSFLRPPKLLEARGVEALPLVHGGELAALAESPDGERLIAVASGRAAIREDGSWKALEGSTVGLAAAGFSGGDVWATDESGALLRLEDGRWSASGGGSSQGAILQRLASSLGGELLSLGATGAAPAGAGAFAFAGSGEGLAGTDSGNVLRYSGERWRLEETPAAVPLQAVAASGEVAVAAGAQGVVVENDGDGWQAPLEPRKLAAGRAFTAADALDDGTIIAITGGALLQRSVDGSWSPAALEPLGVPVRRIAGYRSGDELRVVALAGEGDDAALLQGGADGWRTLDVPAGLRIADFTLREQSGRLSLIGYRDAAPVAFDTELSAR